MALPVVGPVTNKSIKQINKKQNKTKHIKKILGDHFNLT